MGYESAVRDKRRSPKNLQELFRKSTGRFVENFRNFLEKVQEDLYPSSKSCFSPDSLWNQKEKRTLDERRKKRQEK